MYWHSISIAPKSLHGGAVIFLKYKISFDLEDWHMQRFLECNCAILIVVLSLYISLPPTKSWFFNFFVLICSKYRRIVLVGNVNFDLDDNEKFATEIRNLIVSYELEYNFRPVTIVPKLIKGFELIIQHVLTSYFKNYCSQRLNSASE